MFLDHNFFQLHQIADIKGSISLEIFCTNKEEISILRQTIHIWDKNRIGVVGNRFGANSNRNLCCI